MYSRLRRRLIRLMLWVMFLFAFPAVAMAQCSMCRANAAATGSKGMRSINTGILILMVPTVGVMGAIALVAYRRRDK